MQDESKKNSNDHKKEEVIKEDPKKIVSSDKVGAENKKQEASSNEKKASGASPDVKEEKKESPNKKRSAGMKPSKGSKNRSSRKDSQKEKEDSIIEEVVKINRVAKVVKGGKNFSFSALVVAGDGNGSYGIGFGKSNEVVGCIKKGSSKARKKLKRVNLKGDTIPHEVIGRYKSSRVILKPAGRGTGVIAGGPVRALCDAVGVKNILTKSLGSRNAINVVKAAADGFEQLRLERRGRKE